MNAEVDGRMVRVSQRISIAYIQELCWAGVSRRRVSGRTYKSLLRKTEFHLESPDTPTLGQTVYFPPNSFSPWAGAGGM